MFLRYSLRSILHSLHLNRFLRAHFLTAEAANTLLIIINRRIIFAISKIYRLARHRAAVYTDSTTDTFVRLNVWFLLENIQSLGKLCPDIVSYFRAVYVEIGIAVFFY